MGAVYAATHLRLGSRVAIKFLLLERLNTDSVPEAVQRFRREARVAMDLNDENIVHIHDFDEAADGNPYIVMEYLEGEDLDAVLKREAPFSLQRSWDLVRQIASALSVAHGQQVVHRDLKPANIFLRKRSTGEEVVKLVDFGIAKVLDSCSIKTQPNSIMGTPHFMAPEQARSENHMVDGRTDIFSLGCILYYMLSGALPFPGKKYSQVLIGILTKEPRPLEQLTPSVPRAVARVVQRALAKDREQRYQQAAQLTAALHAAIAGEPTGDIPGQHQALGADNPLAVIGTAPGVGPERAARLPLGIAPTLPPGPPTPPEVRASVDQRLELESADSVLKTKFKPGPGGAPAAAQEAEDPQHAVATEASPRQARQGSRWMLVGGLGVAALLAVILGVVWLLGRQLPVAVGEVDAGAVTPADQGAPAVDLPRADQPGQAAPDRAVPDAAPPDRRRPRPRPALINVVTRNATGPVAATIYLDGRKLGQAPRQFKIPAGRHMLRAKARGVPPVLKEIRLRPGARQTVVLTLE